MLTKFYDIEANMGNVWVSQLLFDPTGRGQFFRNYTVWTLLWHFWQKNHAQSHLYA